LASRVRPRPGAAQVQRQFAELVERHGKAAAGPVVTGRSLFDYFPGNEDRFWTMAERVLAGETRFYRSVPHELDSDVLSHWDLVLSPLRRGDEVIASCRSRSTPPSAPRPRRRCSAASAGSGRSCSTPRTSPS